MAAYAALCSLMNIIHQLQNHPHPPIFIDRTQVESLTENVTFLQEFLEVYYNASGYSKEADPLESRIANAAHAAEDVIESYIVDRIHASRDFISSNDSSSHASPNLFARIDSQILTRSPSSDQKSSCFNFCKCFRKAANPGAEDVFESHTVDQIGAALTSHGIENSESHTVDLITAGSISHGIKISSIDMYEGLQKVIQDMDSIRKDVMEIKEEGVRDQLHRNAITSVVSSRPSSTMVGFDDALLEIMDKLTGGQSDRQVIPIVGMGGMGKTTLARNVYVNPLIQQYFDICAWATISQEYDTREILKEIFCQVNKEETGDMNENELGEKLYKYLSGRRYLIVMDDMWSIEAWDGVRRFFPDYNNGSRIVITTRLSNLTSQLSGSYCLEMKFLDEDKSWKLLCKTVFGEEGCPLELEKIGKKIAENCKGLPLSIVVTGGLLVKSTHSPECWEDIAENLNSLVNSEDNERCLNILYMSYKQMPVYLKPCFLYMGVFSEDSKIRATVLMRLWVAEGFLKPISGKSLEDIAEECLKDLTERNLVRASRHVGKIKYCSIHDLLRDLCLREAQKERFYNVAKRHSLDDTEGINTQRRIVIPASKFEKEVGEVQSMSFARSLIWDDGVLPLSLNFRLLRILDAFQTNTGLLEHPCLLENMFDLVNSRYFAIFVNRRSKFPSSVCLLWNLHTITVNSGRPSTAPSEIWTMSQLRHVEFVDGLYLPDPPRKDGDIIVLTNLQSLSKILDFKCSEEVIRRIPNVKKLKVCYLDVGGSSHYFQDNLDRLHKLESFKCASFWAPSIRGTDFQNQLSFPHSLKELNLEASYSDWDEVMEKIGSLPLLEVFKLKSGSFQGCVWETVEGQFNSLKFLSISSLYDLEYWNSESTHFPCLEQLVLGDLHELKEIPAGIGEIPTLQSIDLFNCSYSAAISAKKILEDLEEYGDVTLQVRVVHSNNEDEEALKSLASPNFQVEYFNDWR